MLTVPRNRHGVRSHTGKHQNGVGRQKEQGEIWARAVIVVSMRRNG